MSTQNAISIEISEADRQTASDAADLLAATLMPHLQALTPKQRKTIPRLGPKTEPFVKKVVGYVDTAPEFVPPYMDLAELKKDYDAIAHLTPILHKLQQLTSVLDDSLLLAGSETYKASLSYYSSVQLATKKNVPSAKAIYDDLKKRFEGNGNREKPKKQAAPTPTDKSTE